MFEDTSLLILICWMIFATIIAFTITFVSKRYIYKKVISKGIFIVGILPLLILVLVIRKEELDILSFLIVFGFAYELCGVINKIYKCYSYKK